MRVIAFGAVALAVLAAPAAGHGYKVLYSFCSQNSCGDGQTPNSLAQDAHGNLYGTTYSGGAAGLGTVFELKRKGDSYKYELLYSFCQQTNCVDGGFPTGGLIFDTSGNLYGSALIGGSQGNGEVFELKHGKSGWTIDVLYGFCPQANNCTDGVGPDSGLAYAGQSSGRLYDGASPLYGTTDGGGITNVWQGVAYEVQPGKNGSWSQSVVYSFCAQQNCTDGAYPFGTLMEDSSGNLYGTTVDGGTHNDGTVIELSGSNGSWNESVLYNFCSLAQCTDGSHPHSGLVLDGAGNLDGATLEGGTSCSLDSEGCGVAYTIAAGQETVQHTFCTRTNCADGANPQGTVGGAGETFGTTELGGDAKNVDTGGGTLYDVKGSHFRVLHKFCAKAGCADGSDPLAPPVLDTRGRFFGTASSGGAHAGGVVYEFDK